MSAQASFVNDGLFTEFCKLATTETTWANMSFANSLGSKQEHLFHHILRVMFNLLRRLKIKSSSGTFYMCYICPRAICCRTSKHSHTLKDLSSNIPI